jgi:flagellar basal body L-ring protein FlgH
MKQSLMMSIMMLLLAALVSCQTFQGDYEIKPAPVHEARVSIAESFPEQVFVYIKGGLSDGCTTFNDIQTVRCGDIITITVTTKRPKNAACPQIYGYFEQNVALGSDFTRGMEYVVDVNGTITSFKYPQ